MWILHFIFTIIGSFIVYKLFESKGFKGGLILRIVISLLSYFINRTMTNLYDEGIGLLILSIVIIIVICFVQTFIDYKVYEKTSSFIGYVILSIIVGIIISTVVSLLLMSLVY